MTEETNETRNIGKLGKLPAELPAGLGMLADYLTDPLPAAPASVAVPKIKTWGMYGNSTHGDCTFAGMVHAFMATAADEKEIETFPTAQQTIDAYMAYNQGKDVGCVEATLLQNWKAQSILGREIVAYAPVNIANHDEIKQVIHNYGFVYIGALIAQSAENQFSQGKPWDVTNTPADNQIVGGHCVILVGYDENYFYAITWGQVQKVTPAWLTKFMDEAWAVITPEVSKKGSYNGLNIAQLEADINNLG
jgi:hypothetical protein